MRIGLASADWARGALDDLGRPTWGGSGWARLGLPGRALAGLGLDVVEGTLVWSEKAGRFRVREWPGLGVPQDDPGLFHDVDLVVLQRWMFASVAAESATARRNGQVIVNDLDDHFWALDPRNQAAKASDPVLHPIENRDHYLRVLRASSAVTVSTPYLATVAKRDLGVKCPIHVIPNCVDPSVFQRAYRENHLRATLARSLGVASEAKPTVGWVGGTSWRSGDLETLKGILGPFAVRYGLRAYHGGHREGADTFQDATGLQDVPVSTRPLVPIAEYPSLFEGLGIGLVPLRDAPFNLAKSWIKGLEYAAAGVPFVAQALPEYVRLAATHRIGRVAKRPKEWTRQMTNLLDPQARLDEMEENRRQVEAQFDIRNRVVDWRDVYLDLLASA